MLSSAQLPLGNPTPAQGVGVGVTGVDLPANFCRNSSLQNALQEAAIQYCQPLGSSYRTGTEVGTC